MRLEKSLSIVGAHAEGEVGRVVTAGVSDVPGTTMMDKMRYLAEVDDSLVRFTLFEPRGCSQMSVNFTASANKSVCRCWIYSLTA